MNHLRSKRLLNPFISSDPVQDRNILLDGKNISSPSHDELIKCPFRVLFLKEKDLDIAEIIFNYFSAVREKWPNSWDAKGKTGNLLPRSNAFKALMKYLKDDVYLNLVGDDIGRIPNVEEFSSCFDHVHINDDDFTTRNFAPGSGGQSTFLKILRGDLSLYDVIEDDEIVK